MSTKGCCDLGKTSSTNFTFTCSNNHLLRCTLQGVQLVSVTVVCVCVVAFGAGTVECLLLRVAAAACFVK